MIAVISFFAIFTVTSLVILVANALFSTSVVLGTANISKSWAIIHSIATLALIDIFAVPFIKLYENKTTQTFNQNQWSFAFYFVNLISIWIITRLAEQLGLGVSSWLVVVILTIFVNIAQTLTIIQVNKIKKDLV